MKHIILFDDEHRDNLLPLVYTRPVADLRVGILRIFEKWEIALNAKASFITQDYLSEKYPIHIFPENIIINGALLPNPKVLALIGQLGKNEAILLNERLVAANLDQDQFQKLISDEPIEELNGIEIEEQEDFSFIDYTWDIFSKNGEEIMNDFNRICQGRNSQELSEHVIQYGEFPVFIEEGATLRPCILNTENGPIYIAKNAEVMENSVIRGPFSLGEESVVKIGAKIYSNSTVGPHCKVGGQLNNVVIHSYSNKGHDGFLGNAVIGSWCNIGADSNNSNLKNNYALVKHWNYPDHKFINTGLQFCGLIMGDHSKCAINTMFNTGTSIGVSCNIFGDGFPRNFVPSFSWGGAHGYKTFQINKAYETASVMMKRRGLELDEQEKKILQSIYELSATYRSWETS